LRKPSTVRPCRHDTRTVGRVLATHDALMAEAAFFDIKDYQEEVDKVKDRFDHVESKVDAELDEAIRKIGEKVRDDAQDRFSVVDLKSAAGYRVFVEAGAVKAEVGQSLGRVDGSHPEYGTLQMRIALLPA